MPSPQRYTDTGTGNRPIIDYQSANAFMSSNLSAVNHGKANAILPSYGIARVTGAPDEKQDVAYTDTKMYQKKVASLSRYLVQTSNNLTKYLLAPEGGYSEDDLIYALTFPDGTSVALGRVKELEPITTPGNILKNMWQYTAGQTIKDAQTGSDNLAGATTGVSQVTFVNSARYTKALIPVRFNYTLGLPFNKFSLTIILDGKYNDVDIRRTYVWSSDNYYGNVNHDYLCPYQYILIPGLEVFDIITSITLTINNEDGATASFKDNYIQVYYGKDESDFAVHQQIAQIGVISLSSLITSTEENRASDVPITTNYRTVTDEGVEYNVIDFETPPIILQGFTAKWEDLTEHKLNGLFGSEIQLNPDYIWRVEWYKYNLNQEDYKPGLIPRYWELIPGETSLTYNIPEGTLESGYLVALIGADALTGQDERILYDYIMLRPMIIDSEVNNNG